MTMLFCIAESEIKVIHTYIHCPGHGSNSRPSAHRSFKLYMGKVTHSLTHSATAVVFDGSLAPNRDADNAPFRRVAIDRRSLVR